MAELNTLIRQLEASAFYGSVELKFEGGAIVLIRKTETMKPCKANYRDSRGELSVNTSK